MEGNESTSTGTGTKDRLKFYQEAYPDMYPIFVFDFANHYLELIRNVSVQVSIAGEFSDQEEFIKPLIAPCKEVIDKILKIIFDSKLKLEKYLRAKIKPLPNAAELEKLMDNEPDDTFKDLISQSLTDILRKEITDLEKSLYNLKNFANKLFNIWRQAGPYDDLDYFYLFNDDSIYEMLNNTHNEVHELVKGYKKELERQHSEIPETKLNEVQKVFAEINKISPLKNSREWKKAKVDIYIVNIVNINPFIADLVYILFQSNREIKIQYIHENGRKEYEGQWKEDKLDGFGIEYRSIREKEYEGQWKEGKYDGFGIKYKYGKKYYEGEWKEGKPDGFGIVYHDNGRKEYEGQWKQRDFDGFGIKYHKDGENRYEGQWKKDQLDGFGIQYKDEKKTYEGQWKEDKPDGFGILYFENGEVAYEGQSKNGEPDGFGIVYRENGKKEYEGQWKEGEPDGFGIRYHESGEKDYEGQWEEGEPLF